ncbi:hypothetical protein ACP26F_04445 [Franconibacter pulveris 1160]|uniref:hypothetical protein n=1 Tax=Franconibacter pulveris TaxID=435910 RepID=UPI001268A325|nr:hypothetical protein [Franconibacter pulveris]
MAAITMYFLPRFAIDGTAQGCSYLPVNAPATSTLASFLPFLRGKVNKKAKGPNASELLEINEKVERMILITVKI